MKKLLSFLLLCCLVFSFVVIGNAAQYEQQPSIDVFSDSALIVNADLVSQNKQWENTNYGMRVGFRLSNYPQMQSFLLLISYDANILEYTDDFIGATVNLQHYTRTCTLLEPGKLQVTVEDGVCENLYNYIDSIAFLVKNPGNSKIEVSLLSFVCDDGTVINDAALSVNFKTTVAVDRYLADRYLSAPESVAQCVDGNDHVWIIKAGMTVGDLRKVLVSQGELDFYSPMENGRIDKLTDDDRLGTGCGLNCTVDGKIVTFRKFCVVNDLSGDGLVTTEDARLALRISVGLEDVTEVQCYAAGTRNKDKITTSVARSILRYAVGLE